MNSKSILYIGNNFTNKTKYNSTMFSLSNLLKNNGYKVYLSSDKKNKILRLLDMFLSVIINRNKVDVMLIDTFSTTNFYYALITSQLGRIFKIKYIPILHGGNLPIRINKSKWLSKLIFNNSYLNVSPSEYLKFEFQKKGFKSLVIPNLIDINDYNFKLRRNLKPSLLFVRAFANIYNPLMALNVLDKLKIKYPKAKLCMIGPFKDESILYFKEKTKQLNLQDSVEILGVLPKEEWHKESEKYDIFINTTNIDNTPVSLIEAMALGLPIVSTNVGGIPYLINDKEDGLLVEKNNVNQMVDCIDDLINNKFSNLSINARKKVESFDSKIVLKKWNSVLNE